MAKNLKLKLKNAQLAEALNISSVRPKKPTLRLPKEELPAVSPPTAEGEEAPKRVRARTKKADVVEEQPAATPSAEIVEEAPAAAPLEELAPPPEPIAAAPLPEIEPAAPELQPTPEPKYEPVVELESAPVQEPLAAPPPPKPRSSPPPARQPFSKRAFHTPLRPLRGPGSTTAANPLANRPTSNGGAASRLGPTGRHVNDLLKPRPAPAPSSSRPAGSSSSPRSGAGSRFPSSRGGAAPAAAAPNPFKPTFKREARPGDDSSARKAPKFQDVKPLKRAKGFDGRDRQGLTAGDDERWLKKRNRQQNQANEFAASRPTAITVRLPISIKDLAQEMKLKASQLIAKLFMQGIVVTLNDLLDDETTVQLMGHEFGCQITIDTTEEQKVRVTSQSIQEEIVAADPSSLVLRPPVITFMGHVDHGKTSLIDAIRKSDRVSGEAGAITQHIGAFSVTTAAGKITVLDTPGHEAFSAMRERGAEVTDIVVLVIAGDEGMRPQTIEALNQAKAAGVTIVCALNKCDKPGYNPEQVYQQMAQHELVPEDWGGSTICVRCSALTGEGIQSLLEMLALQAEVLELHASTASRARGTVLESHMHKGLGMCATVLIQNGTLRPGDAIVFGQHWGRVKNMQDEHGSVLKEAGPSCPALITGLSGLPIAGDEFVVVKNEKEAKEIAEVRQETARTRVLQQKKRLSLEKLAEKATSTKKDARFVLKADVQGSLEALRSTLESIDSEKVDIHIIGAGVGEITESDVQLASASSAIIIGFHTKMESHVESMAKALGVKVHRFDVIFHAVDEVKKILIDLLDKVVKENEMGAAEVRAVFKSSHLGLIAGCSVTEGVITRSAKARVVRGGEVIWKGPIASLKRVKDDVREVKKGVECGIVLQGFSDVQIGDIIQAYDVEYLTQEL